MIKVDLHTEVFNPVYLKHLTNLARTQIFFGGSASGKSVFLAQRAVYDLLAGGRNYLVCRQVGRTLRGSVAQEIGKIIAQWGLSEVFSINKTDGTITCDNGYQIVFSGLDDVEKLKSITPAKGAFTDIWLEEATEAEADSLKQLIKRQRGGSGKIAKRLTLSFNPILQSHWIYKEYFSKVAWTDEQTEHHTDALSILKTTYKDNKFLTAEDVRDLENETDQYYYDVYTLGKWGVLGNVIFRNYKVAEITAEQRKQFDDWHNGLDFGFATDPAAMVNTHYDSKRKTIYVFDELYETGLTNDVLAERVKEKIGDDHITCDSSEPKSIAELRQHGVSARGAAKGKDSVEHGIQWLQQQTIIIAPECINLKNELQQYHWKKDAGGNVIRKPVDKFNHLIDALRYAYEDDMNGMDGLPISFG